jgi:hypothetical protein
MGHFTAAAAIGGILSLASWATLIFIHFQELASPDKACGADVVSGDQFTRRNKHFMRNLAVFR